MGWDILEKEDVIMVKSPLNLSYKYVTIDKLKYVLGPTRGKWNEKIIIDIKSEGEDEEYKVKTTITYRDNDNDKERIVYEVENVDDSFILNHSKNYKNDDSCPFLDRFIFSVFQRYVIGNLVENNKKKEDMSKKEMTIGEEFENFMSFAMRYNYKKVKLYKPSEIAEIYRQNGMTEEMLYKRCIGLGCTEEESKMLVQKCFHPTEKDLELEK